MLLREHVLHFERRDAELAQRHPDFLDAVAHRNVGQVWNLLIKGFAPEPVGLLDAPPVESRPVERLSLEVVFLKGLLRVPVPRVNTDADDGHSRFD